MQRAVSSRSAIGVSAGLVVALAGLGAYLISSLGGPGTTAFLVRLLLVAITAVGAVLVGLAVRLPSSRMQGAPLAYSERPTPEQ